MENLRNHKKTWMRYAAGLLVLLLGCFAAGCQAGPEAGTETPEEPGLDVQHEQLIADEVFPRLDGSTANIPLGEAVYRYFTGATAAEAEREINFYKTDNAYYNLCYGYADLLLVYEGGQEVLAEIEWQGAALTQKEIGLDALVFLTSADNPVENLSLADIQNIYSGEYDNWSQVGGSDLEIAAYQRNEESGSQALMRKLVMADTEMAEPEMIPVLGDMGSLLEEVAEYRNEANALGYSVYYYAANMYAVENVKLLAVDGVMPTNETIADGSYPLCNAFYAIIREEEAADSSARQIYDFLSTPQGKALITEAGYVAAP